MRIKPKHKPTVADIERLQAKISEQRRLIDAQRFHWESDISSAAMSRTLELEERHAAEIEDLRERLEKTRTLLYEAQDEIWYLKQGPA